MAVASAGPYANQFVLEKRPLNVCVCVVYAVVASSGAVDEDLFDRSFGQVPVINVSYCGFTS